MLVSPSMGSSYFYITKTLLPHVSSSAVRIIYSTNQVFFNIFLRRMINMNGIGIRISRIWFMNAFSCLYMYICISLWGKQIVAYFKPSAPPCSLQERNSGCVCFFFMETRTILVDWKLSGIGLWFAQSSRCVWLGR